MHDLRQTLEGEHKGSHKIYDERSTTWLAALPYSILKRQCWLGSDVCCFTSWYNVFLACLMVSEICFFFFHLFLIHFFIYTSSSAIYLMIKLNLIFFFRIYKLLLFFWFWFQYTLLILSYERRNASQSKDQLIYLFHCDEKVTVSNPEKIPTRKSFFLRRRFIYSNLYLQKLTPNLYWLIYISVHL